MTTSGVKVLRKVQLGRQASAHTAVPATTVWRGPAIMPSDDDTHVMPEENIGFSSKTTRSYSPSKYASLVFPTTEATFQGIQHVLEGGVKTVTPVADGVGTGFVNAYPLPSGDVNATKLYTIEGGDNKTVEEIEDAFVVDFELSGKKNESWMLTSSWGGRQAVVSAFTAGLSIPVVSEMLFNKSKLFIDEVGGTLGNTQIVNSWIEAKLKITTGLKAQFTAEGERTFSFVDFIGARATLELSLLHNATVAAEREKFRSDTARQIRMLIEGKTLTTPGTYSKETFRVDGAGLYTSFGAPNDEDEGSNVNKAVFEMAYDATAALFCNLLLVNQLSAVP